MTKEKEHRQTGERKALLQQITIEESNLRVANNIISDMTEKMVALSKPGVSTIDKDKLAETALLLSTGVKRRAEADNSMIELKRKLNDKR